MVIKIGKRSSVSSVIRRRLFLSSILTVSFLSACRSGEPAREHLAAYLRAKNSYSAGDLSGAEALLREVVVAVPGFYQAHFLLGKTLFFKNAYEEAEAQLEEVLTFQPDYREAELFLIRLLMQTGRIESGRRKHCRSPDRARPPVPDHACPRNRTKTRPEEPVCPNSPDRRWR